MRSYIINILACYPRMCRQIEVLRYELAHPSHVSAAEMLQAMALGHGECTNRTVGHISDKTLYIALNYQSKAAVQNCQANEELVSTLIQLEAIVNRLDHCMSHLAEPLQLALRCHDCEGKSWSELAQEFGVTERTLQRHRAKAIDELAAMYEILKQTGVILD